MTQLAEMRGGAVACDHAGCSARYVEAVREGEDTREPALVRAVDNAMLHGWVVSPVADAPDLCPAHVLVGA